MYPYLRFGALVMRERRLPKIGLYDTHSMQMRCLPVDIDMFMEMNNGRILTLFDLGRFALSIRTGLWDVLKEQRWGLVVAGSTTRYRARVTPFQRFEMRTRFLGWDDKFMYLEQAMWRGETCCNHALLRTGVTVKGRLAPPGDVAVALGITEDSRALPQWVQDWAQADRSRIWPPEV